MSVENFYNTTVPDNEVDISASKRKFQVTYPVKQNPDKDGILSFLQDLEPTQPSGVPAASTTTPPQQTVRPSSGQGGY